MMKTILYFLFLFTHLTYSQINGDTDDGSGDGRALTEVEFERAKILYKNYVTSDDVIEKKKLLNKITLISNGKSHPQDFIINEENITEKKIKDWVEKNVAVKKYNKALKLLSKAVLLNDKINRDNSEIINILKYKASFSQCQEIVRPN